MVRPITLNDAQGLLDYFAKLVRIDPERVERPQDVDKITLEAELTYIQKRLELQKTGEIVLRCVEKQGAIIAFGEVERLKRWIERHVAEIRFGVYPHEAHEAIALVGELEALAKKIGVEVLIYFHLATQKASLDVMHQCGYKEVGRVKGYYKRNGELIDRIYLSKSLK